MIPTYIRVGPFRFCVIADKVVADGAGSVAHIQQDYERITYDPTLPGNVIRKGLLHEVLHAVYYVAGQMGKRLSEEDAVTAIAPSLLATLRDNPELVAFLTEDAG